MIQTCFTLAAFFYTWPDMAKPIPMTWLNIFYCHVPCNDVHYCILWLKQWQKVLHNPKPLPHPPQSLASWPSRSSAVETAGIRRRKLTARTTIDDAPGLKISPTVVLVMSLCFSGFVTALHVFGKLYRSKSGAEA
ncbi:hypothetical protein SLEP1_g26400 [Rubroshorea leprosula]|uniref:Uncharacterized protein n=1 Tax=Rubroshorea leprosula TaxID=152421 RepID=A0AAV5JZC4_9ROSI|nr:hypothetical protein SLEP1_g26400 [Rubroshorea leprosula]